jgi:2-oxoglutarate dehydrogenase E2 component (dihydrolipoamide succinyltransferase)
VTIRGAGAAAGVLSEIAVKDGETVAVGALLGQIKEGAGAPTKPAAAAPAGRPDEKSSTTTPINAAEETPAPRVPPNGRCRPGEQGARCAARAVGCASCRRKAASMPPPFPAPARTAASPRGDMMARHRARRLAAHAGGRRAAPFRRARPPAPDDAARESACA